jgi:hypothetical protein
LPSGQKNGGRGCQSHYDLKNSKELCSKKKSNANPLKGSKEPVFYGMNFQFLFPLYLNEKPSLFLENKTEFAKDRQQQVYRKAKEKRNPEESEEPLVDRLEPSEKSELP